MVRWQAELVGHEFDLDDLRTQFSEPHARVRDENGHFYLEASEFEPLADFDSVRAAAHRLLDRINGAMRLYNTSYRNVQLGPIQELKPDGSRSTVRTIGLDAVLERERAMPITATGGAPAPATTDRASRSVELAAQDPDVAEALDLWANEVHNWVNLYKVFEIVRSRQGINHGHVSKKEITRFTRTANHQGAAGRAARHARLPEDPPEHPMALPDAERLVARLLQAWIDTIRPADS
ncbi:MAG TPA: hypothetical protein VFA46_23200 [Actinomycetes bacterium]|jgi:hypothetical protein|nr:hypothetical protein [Actinomycetes bacterium]